MSILGTLMPALGDTTSGSKHFFDMLVRSAPKIRTSNVFACLLRTRASTLISRFHRAGLPSPKRYLVEMRLLYAGALFQAGAVSIAEVAYRLDYSSPQSFGRTVQMLKGMPASAFRRYSFSEVLDQYAKVLIVPYRTTFLSFDPLANRKTT
jgi:AraC-like DNA-binding protein